MTDQGHQNEFPTHPSVSREGGRREGMCLKEGEVGAEQVSDRQD